LNIALMVEGQEGVTWPQWRELALTAEELGFAALFRSDHYLSEQPDSGRGGLEAWGTICALAAVTNRIRLGTLVSPATFRHPSVLAKLVVTADHVSGGRVELGLGAGWFADEHRAYGFPFHAGATRLDVLEEQTEIIRRSWADGSFSFDGRHYHVEHLDALPKPLQQPGPPIIVGGYGMPRSVSVAARWADEYNTPLASLDELARRQEAVREACERVDRDPATIGFSVMARVLIGADRHDLEERARRDARLEGQGNVDPRAYLSRLADTSVFGTVEQTARQLKELSALGVQRVMLEPLDHTDLEMVKTIATDLIPALGGV
jgi:F420-dependent oxidoreductase-like protein